MRGRIIPCRDVFFLVVSHWTYLLISILVTFGGLVLMGLPAALLMHTIGRMARLVRLPLPDPGDRALALALGITILWGPMLYACYWLTRLFGWATWSAWPLWLLAGFMVTFDLWPQKK